MMGDANVVKYAHLLKRSTTIRMLVILNDDGKIMMKPIVKLSQIVISLLGMMEEVVTILLVQIGLFFVTSHVIQK